MIHPDQIPHPTTIEEAESALLVLMKEMKDIEAQLEFRKDDENSKTWRIRARDALNHRADNYRRIKLWMKQKKVVQNSSLKSRKIEFDEKDPNFLIYSLSNLCAKLGKQINYQWSPIDQAIMDAARDYLRVNTEPL